MLKAMRGTPAFSRMYREVHNVGHSLSDIEEIECKLLDTTPQDSFMYTIFFTNGSTLTYCEKCSSHEPDRFKAILAEMNTWSTLSLQEAANAITRILVDRTITHPYNSHEDNIDYDRNNRTPAATGKDNAPAAPPISAINCKTTYEYDRISGQYTFSTDDPEAAPYISPAD
jgi:hypothetical protein